MPSVLHLTALALCFIGVKSTAEELWLVVNTSTNRVEDQYGRERYFHGTNVVYKGPPYIPVTDHFDPFLSFADQDMELLADMGYNTIRLGVEWAGAEPEDGTFNETYFKLLQALVEHAGRDYGIYPLLDMHQDVFNEQFCGEGVPNWAAVPNEPTFPVPLTDRPWPVDNTTHWPNQSLCDTKPWAAYHFTFALSSAVERLYVDIPHRFARFWGKVAAEWADSPYIVGYELINEPWAGDVFKNPTLLVPGVADRERLQPLYDQVNIAIREADPRHLVFFESVTWEVLGIGEALGFTHVPGGADYRNRSVLSFHNSVAITPDAKYYPLRMGEVQRLGCAGWVTETGVDQLALADEWGLSWMHWEYKAFVRKTGWSYGLYTSNGTLDQGQVAVYSRTYAKAVAGHVTSFTYNVTSQLATLTYIIRSGCTMPTIIYLNEAVHYPSGFAVDVAPAGLASWSHPERNHIHITHTQPALSGVLHVVIRQQ